MHALVERAAGLKWFWGNPPNFQPALTLKRSNFSEGGLHRTPRCHSPSASSHLFPERFTSWLHLLFTNLQWCTAQQAWKIRHPPCTSASNPVMPQSLMLMCGDGQRWCVERESGAAVSQTDSALGAVCRCLSGEWTNFPIMKPGVQTSSRCCFLTHNLQATAQASSSAKPLAPRKKRSFIKGLSL